MKNLRIGIKTGICFGLILIMFAGLSYSSLLNLNRIKAKTSDVIKIKDNIGNIQRFSEHLIDAETGQRGFMITGKEEYLEPYHRAVNHLEIELVELSSLLSESSQQHKNYIELETMVKEKLQEMESTIDAFHQEGIEHAHEIVKAGQGKELMDRIRAVLDKVEREEEVQLEKKYAEMEWVENHARRIITWIGSVVLLFVILVTYYFTVTISRPTEYVARQVSLISKGDLRKPIKRVERRDEIGLMINSLAAMSEVLQQQLRDIRNGIDVLSSSSSEIMSGVAQLAASASETATAIGQTTTTIEEVKQTAEVSNRKSQEVSAESRKNARISDEGNKAIQETNESMQVIKQKMDMIATVVLSLNEQSHTIGEITATVNDLAEQSNILAVNAAIEAAKAGEQGKGFAVVASEIKNLATRSKEATSQVRMILNEVQKSISKVVMATEDGGKTVENGSELLKATREAIELLSQSVTLAAQASVQIASSSQQQLVGMDQIVAAMENIRDSSSQIAATTQQTSFSVNDLHRVGERLQEMINFYKVQA